MTYKQVLSELDAVGLKNKFTESFENLISNELLFKFKNTNKMHSVGSLIRVFLGKLEIESKEWIYWQKVLIYFMQPLFVRDIKELPNYVYRS